MAFLKTVLFGIFAVGFICVKACSDFVFIVDGEVNENNFVGRTLQRRKEIALKTAQQLDLGFHRAALIFYGRRPSDNLLITSFEEDQTKDLFTSKLRAQFDNLLLKNASKSLEPSYGASDAIDTLLKQILPHKRMGAPVVILFFTDGKARENEFAKLETLTAKLAKKHYVHSFVVNPESLITDERLRTLLLLTNNEKNSIISAQLRGQQTPEQHLLSVLRPFISCEQTSKLKTLRRKPIALAPAASVSTSSTTTLPKIPPRASRFNPRTTATTKTTSSKPTFSRSGSPGCMMDIVFLMDFSGGARDKREKYINIASEMIRNMQLGENATQIAFVRYSGLRRTDSVFHLKKHYNASEAIAEIDKTPTLGGLTRTGAAMLDASKEFDRRFGGRTTAQKFMVVFTDAYSQDDPVDASAKLYQERVKVLAVAVDDASQPPDHEQLKAIATDQKSIFLEKDFPKLFTYFTQCRQ
uniref:VWFA domain-containing protein n=1 Tax=Panagrolaimus sp. ES5 TaxID=591445 RepID=A0AC34G553_9BILA